MFLSEVPFHLSSDKASDAASGGSGHKGPHHARDYTFAVLAPQNGAEKRAAGRGGQKQNKRMLFKLVAETELLSDFRLDGADPLVHEGLNGGEFVFDLLASGAKGLVGGHHSTSPFRRAIP